MAENLEVYTPVKLPGWLANDLTRLAEVEARRDGGKPNISATVRRAIVAYVEAQKQDKQEDRRYE